MSYKALEKKHIKSSTEKKKLKKKSSTAPKEI